jgi:hypothetical protein
VPSSSIFSPAVSERTMRQHSSRYATVVGFLPITRRALSPRPMPRSMRPPVTSLSVASAEAVTVMSRVAGFVTQVPRRMWVVAAPMRVSSGYGSRHRTCESNIQPYAKPLASARFARSTLRSNR